MPIPIAPQSHPWQQRQQACEQHNSKHQQQALACLSGTANVRRSKHQVRSSSSLSSSPSEIINHNHHYNSSSKQVRGVESTCTGIVLYPCTVDSQRGASKSCVTYICLDAQPRPPSFQPRRLRLGRRWLLLHRLLHRLR